MTRSFERFSSRVSRRASYRISVSTAGDSSVRRPHGDRIRRGPTLVAAIALTASCAYFNTFYNAEQAYEEGIRLNEEAGDSLTMPARLAFQRAAEKSAIVLDRYADSSYADDALVLLGLSLYQLRSYGDASATFERYLTRFPEGDRAFEARLAWVRSERLQEKYDAALAALAPLIEDSGDLERAEVLYEKALIDLGMGQFQLAASSFLAVIEEYPQFAGTHGLSRSFADAQLEAGEYEAALESYTALSEVTADPVARTEIAFKVAQTLVREGRREEAIAAYGEILETSPSDSARAEIHVERGELYEAVGDWEDAETEYRRAAELAPGTVTGSRATLHRGRIAWMIRGNRTEALDIMLDAFIHRPNSAFGDTAREAARDLERLIHYQRLSEGLDVVEGIDDPALVRSTAMYRLAEEIRQVEQDPDRAIALFSELSRQYPDSRWRPRALLAVGVLEREQGRVDAGNISLRAVVEEYPDLPEADSARRVLGLPIPEREADFYSQPELVVLTNSLPRVEDPMVRIIDQLDRYAGARAARARQARGAGTQTGAQGQADVGDATAQEPPEPEEPELPSGIEP